MRYIAVALLLSASRGWPARLTPAADSAFADYVSSLEARLAMRPSVEHPIRPGEIRTEPVNRGLRELPGALLHHWRGSAFVPGATPDRILALLRDYNRLSRYYAPEVVASRALKDEGRTALISMRLREHRVRTIVLDAEYRVENGLDDNSRGFSYSRSTHIWQVDDAGTPREHRRAEGNDEGFLWRLNSYWSFKATPGGLFIECEAVSLTRDVPTGLGWLLRPVIQDFPSSALQFTLRATRNALIQITAGKEQG